MIKVCPPISVRSVLSCNNRVYRLMARPCFDRSSPSARKRGQAMAKSRSKRKLDQENRVFQVKWESDYLFTEFKDKPMCLVCLETLSAMKDFNLSRHYNTLHKVKYEKYTEAARAALIADLKSKVHNVLG